MRLPPGWTASGSGKCHRRFTKAGWTVFHCGHPTALWPWGVLDPDGVLHTSGKTCALGVAFRYLAHALAHVERHLQDGA